MNRFNHQDHLCHLSLQHVTRRHFLRDSMASLGAIWLQSNLTADAASAPTSYHRSDLSATEPHFQPHAKRVIYLHMAGAPSQLELFEYKPDLNRLNGKPCPQEYMEGKRFAFIRGVPEMLGSIYPFHQSGDSGMWISDRLPHFESVIDKVCFIRTMQSEQFNHAPAQLLLHTGNQNLGHASMGSWVTYGLGTENQNLPGFVVLVSGGKNPSAGKSVWGNGFLPSVYQGVQCRSYGDPVPFLSNPDGIDSQMRREIIDAINNVNQLSLEEFGDPETATRISQYELAYRMQLSASDAMDISQEPQHIHDSYGTELGKESFANNCLLARRLAERDVRFIQLYDWGWDSHGAAESEALNIGFKEKCRQIDQPIAALLRDLDQRGLLEDTLVVWGGEFGRTPMRENRGGKEMKYVGRDHHPSCFTIWMAGGGVKPGFSHGETDPFGFAPTSKPVLIRDFQATLLHLLGLDNTRLVYPFQGLDQKITGVKPAHIVTEIFT